MNMKLTLCGALVFLGSAVSSGQDLIKLEHTFDGYYSPFNFPFYTESDNDRFFMQSSPDINVNSVSLRSYNEDYSIRDDYSVTFAVPDGYQTTSVSFSPSMRMPDGTMFFIVNFNRQNSSTGNDNYCRAIAFDAADGKQIFDLGSSNSNIIALPYLYEINGKRSLVIQYLFLELNTLKISYITKVFSFGEATSGEDTPEAAPRKLAEPIRTFDVNGRIIDTAIPGQPAIIQMSDGTAVKTFR